MLKSKSTLFTTMVKLYFAVMNEFKLNWYICAKITDVVKNVAVIKSVSKESFFCTYLIHLTNLDNNFWQPQ